MTNLRILPLFDSAALPAYARDTIPMSIIHILYLIQPTSAVVFRLILHHHHVSLHGTLSLDSPPNRLDLFPTRSIFPQIDNQVKSWSILSCVIDDVTLYPLSTIQRSKMW